MLKEKDINDVEVGDYIKIKVWENFRPPNWAGQFDYAMGKILKVTKVYDDRRYYIITKRNDEEGIGWEPVEIDKCYKYTED